jgi:hypothetical protein
MGSIDFQLCSSDPYLRLTVTDPASNPALLVSDLQGANTQIIFLSTGNFYAYSFLKVHLHHS